MQITFTCPKTQKTFETAVYRIVEDKGARITSWGEKVWEASVQLSNPCPHCGEQHTYDPGELPCPFTSQR